MPVGTGFENSAMKASFSLSSLLQAAPETPDKPVKYRECNSLSLKKKKREEKWRKSWGSTGGSTASEQKDDFWSALQANYDYIMDNQLIDNCQEANGELTMDTPMWSLREFYMQFSELYSWLNSVQEKYEKELKTSENVSRNHYITELAKKSSLVKLFTEQASHLIKLHPEMEEEVTCRAMRLNSKWETLESVLGLSDCRSYCNNHNYCTDIQHELKRLRSWMENAESRLQPLVFRVKWSKTEIENKIMDHKILHLDIESHGKLVTYVIKLCEEKAAEARPDCANLRRVAKKLERRWHLLFLRSLEWQCYIDTLHKNISGKNQTTLTESSGSENDEPLHKHPRLDDANYLTNLDSFQDKSHSEGSTSAHTMVKPNIQNEANHKASERLKLSEDTSTFTKSNRKAPNFGTYYFRHEDTTDSEIQISSDSKAKEHNTTVDESSEDEWSYEPNNKMHTENKCNVAMQQNVSPTSKDIRRLVKEAEELVRESPIKRAKSNTGVHLNKMSRVKQWLNIDKPSDSCDASCEEEEKDSQSSEDLNESVATCRAPSQEVVSQGVDIVDGDTPKIIFRQRRTDLKRNRPWSLSCLSQLSSIRPRTSECSNFSISESALNQLPIIQNSTDSFDTSANTISVYHNNSTSSTMEESGTVLPEHNTSNRRRRLKFRKRNSSRRRNEGTESLCMLTKSRSFSGSSCKTPYIERNAVSDPSTLHSGQTGLYMLTNNKSDTESTDDRYCKGIPKFKIGEATYYLSKESSGDGPVKVNLTNVEEQSSSLSEQAWDSYQEKYLSEAYSETQDSDAARRLLEFGEDYRNFLDSQSDWSTQSTNPEFSPPFKRKTLAPFDILESESDSEDIGHLLQESRDELLKMGKLYNQQLTAGPYEPLSGISEIIATCERHICCLSMIENSPEEYSLTKLDRERSSDLLSQWKRLMDRVNTNQEFRSLQKQISILKYDLEIYKGPVSIESVVFNTANDICEDITFHTEKLENMEKKKSTLLTLNVAVHRFVIENMDFNSSILKADISELYRLWYEIHSSVTEKINRLRCLLQTWQTFESRLDKLQLDLQEDKETLAVLDSALRSGSPSNNTATTIRDVAKLLSETNPDSRLSGLLSECSYSDSGISDEGSEHEQGERERRLASIRHLVRQLETIMSPDCLARTNMSQRLLATEDELKSLQKHCRSLVVRTAVNAVIPHCEQAPTAVSSDPGDPEDKSGSSSWFKRVMRASIPFQLAIMALLCLACLLEPHCCDSMNNFSMSFSPQLRYVRGPPPV